MKNRALIMVPALLAFWILNVQPSTVFAQGTAFTYQGQLQNNGALANGTYNLQFSLYTNSASGSPVAGPITNSAVTVSGGLFTVTMDFGLGPWNGQTNWLQIGVESNGISSFTPLSPRQQLTPVPYAITAENVSGTIGSSAFSGTYSGAVTLNNPTNQFSGTFTGNGSGLTNANAATLGGLGATNFWLTSGNTGTSPTNGNFLGTMDQQPVEIRVGGLRGWRVEPDPRGDGAANLIGGYVGNGIQQPGSGGDFIGGGGYGGGFNTIDAYSSGDFIGGGSGNQIGTNISNGFIGGGYENVIGSYGSGGATGSVIGGGYNNAIDEEDSFIGGGQLNSIQSFADHSVIGGGESNTIVGSYSLPVYCVIVGGENNIIQTNSSYDFIGGGLANTIQSNTFYAVVPGGSNNVAGGADSFAAGTSAQATNSGAFVWSDNSTANSFSSTANNQFSVRALGGVRVVTGGTGMTVDGQTVGPLGNYVFAYSTTPQSVTPSVFQSATFNTDAQLNGWAALGNSQFSCNQAGLYLVQYTAEASVADSMSLRAELNFAEIPGSQAYANSTSFGTVTAISRSFLASVPTPGSILMIQYTGNSSGDELEGGGSGSTLPSVSLTITRIQ